MTKTTDTATDVRQALADMRAALEAARATSRQLRDTLAELDRIDAAFAIQADCEPPVAARHPADRPRKGENARVLTGRAGRRQTARAEARAAARELRTREDKPKPHARVIGHVQRALCTASWGLTAREYLIGLGFEEWERYESAFGRQVAKTYRLNHGCEPDRGARVVLRGRVWRAMRYANAADLEAGAAAYKRTAHLVG
jgi:hypothetical protein